MTLIDGILLRYQLLHQHQLQPHRLQHRQHQPVLQPQVQPLPVHRVQHRQPQLFKRRGL